MCGHSYMFWAGKRAGWTSWGPSLGLGAWFVLEWRGGSGMLWDEFVELASPGTPDVTPDILVVHSGGNNLALRLGRVFDTAGHC